MSIIKTFAIAALSLGITGGALAAKNQFIAPDVVRAFVQGDVESMYKHSSADEQRLLTRYAVGFAGGLDRRCQILDQAAAAKLHGRLREFSEQLQADKTAGREPSMEARAILVGYQDASTLADGYGCRSDVGIGASRTVRHLLAGLGTS
jgi:hypothetical protein